MQVVLDLGDEDITPEEERQIRFLLMDALYEFGARRTPSPQYVAQRYDHLEGEAVPRKIVEVEGRVYLASKLHRARISIIKSE